MDVGERVHGKRLNEKGEWEDPTVLADGPATDQGEIALGPVSYTHLDVYKRQIDTIIQRLNTDAKAETDALLEKARQEAAAVAASYQAQADKEAADLAARNERLAAEREERQIGRAHV